MEWTTLKMNELYNPDIKISKTIYDRFCIFVLDGYLKYSTY